MTDYEEIVGRLEHGNIQQRATAIAMRYGQFDGAHHKAWCIDQMMRILAGESYASLVRAFENGGEYEWDKGIAP